MTATTIPTATVTCQVLVVVAACLLPVTSGAQPAPASTPETAGQLPADATPPPSLPAPQPPAPPPPAQQPSPIDVHWAWIQGLLGDPTVIRARKIEVLKQFIMFFPGDHPRRSEAAALVAHLERGERQSALDDFTTSTEWFAFQIGGGPYVAAVGFDFFTLRWPRLFWEIVHFRANAFISVGAVEAGSVVGYPLRLDALGRHELRFGVAFVFATIMRNDEGTWNGFGLTPQVSYHLRRSKHLAFDFTVSVLVPLTGKYSDVENPPKRPPPCPIGAVGMRF